MSNYQNPSVQLREAYNRTLKGAEFSGSASFCCGPGDDGVTYILCQECPLNRTDCEEKHNAEYWRQWWKVLTGEEDNVPHLATLEEAMVNPKFKMVYSLLDQPEEHTIESADLSTVLYTLNLWYKEAIKWNLIAYGSTSDVPCDFKDIYFRLYDSGGNLALIDTYTLKSVGLTKQWVRNNNATICS